MLWQRFREGWEASHTPFSPVRDDMFKWTRKRDIQGILSNYQGSPVHE